MSHSSVNKHLASVIRRKGGFLSLTIAIILISACKSCGSPRNVGKFNEVVLMLT